MHANLRKYSSTLLLLMSFSQHYWLCCLFESIYEFYKCHFFVLIFISVQFDQESLSSLSQLYGHFLYAQKRIRERLQACKNHARIAAFFQVCSHLYISTKYSKKSFINVFHTNKPIFVNRYIDVFQCVPSDVRKLDVAGWKTWTYVSHCLLLVSEAHLHCWGKWYFS